MCYQEHIFCFLYHSLHRFSHVVVLLLQRCQQGCRQSCVMGWGGVFPSSLKFLPGVGLGRVSYIFLGVGGGGGQPGNRSGHTLGAK